MDPAVPASQTIEAMAGHNKNIPRSPFIEAYEKATSDFGLCPNRVWAVCGKRLPDILPANNNGIPRHQDHEQCTYEFCEYSQRDFTAVSQRHECRQPEDQCHPLRELFSPSNLEDAVRADMPTAWSLDGRTTIQSDDHYMAISHVWSDGTGTGAWPAGHVNPCLYEFFRKVAYQFHCEGVWWDTLCIPQDKILRTQVIRSMHTRYRDARVTLVHDVFLRETQWISAEKACFAILMSPWFSRGWTALELAESRKVKVMFGGPNGPLIKDLDQEILSSDDAHDSEPHQLASQLIRNLRKARNDLNQLLTILGSRFTSWPKDVAIIAGLLAGLNIAPQPGQVNISPQDVIARVLAEKIGYIFPGHLFHNKATMSKGVSWCPISLLSMPVSRAPASTALRIDSSFNVVGTWKAYPIPEMDILGSHCVWDAVHSFAREKILSYITTSGDNCLLLVEPSAESLNRALLVLRESQSSEQPGMCLLVGALYFHPPLDSSDVNDKAAVETQIIIRGRADDDAIPLPAHPDAGSSDSAPALKTGTDSLSKSDSLHISAWRGTDDTTATIQDQIGPAEAGTVRALLNEKDHLGRQLIHLAAERGDNEVIGFLLKQPDLLPSEDKNGRSALHYAAWGGSVTILNALLAYGFDPEAADADGKRALHFACEHGFINIVKILIELHPKTAAEQNPHDLTPLHYASFSGHENVTKLLIQEYGSKDIQAQESQLGWTPLHLAALNGQDHLARILLASGANPAAEDNRFGWTPLHCAAAGGYGSTITHLLQHGSSPQTQDKYGWFPLHLAKLRNHKDAIACLGEIHPHQDLTATPPLASLHSMVAYGPHAVSNLLFRFKAIELLDLPWHSSTTSGSPPVDDKGQTLLHAAILHDRHGLAQQLLDEGHALDKEDDSRFTPLDYAMATGRTVLIRFLLTKGAKYDNNRSPSILHLAAKSGFNEIFDTWPIDKTVDQTDVWSQTPLAVAAMFNQVAFMDQLLARGAEVDVGDFSNMTPLLRAIEAGHLEAVKKLLANGADATTRDSSETTALAIACRWGHKNIADYLLEKGYKLAIHSTNSWGNAVLDFAVFSGNSELVLMLLMLDHRAALQKADSDSDDDSLLSIEDLSSTAEAVEVLVFGSGDSHDNARDPAGKTLLFEVAKRAYEPSEDQGLGPRTRNVSEKGHGWLGIDDGNPYILSLSQISEETHRRAIRLLLEAGADTKAIVENAPLVTWAAERGDLELLKLLIDKMGVDVNSLDGPRQLGRALLSYAAINGHKNVVRYLVEKGANVSHRDKLGQTPLTLAIGSYSSSVEMVQFLLEQGAKIVDKEGVETEPLDFVMRSSNKESLMALFS